MEEGERIVVAVFPVLGEPAAAVEPGDGALNDPALGFDDKALGAISAFDNLDYQTAHRSRGALSEDRSRIGAVSEQLAQERELSKQSGQQENATVAILNIGRSHQRVQHQAQRIDQDVTLLTFDQLAGIEAMRVDARAPFSALFTVWLLCRGASCQGFANWFRCVAQIPTGARASLRGRHVDRHSMGSEDEVEQSVKRAHSGRLR